VDTAPAIPATAPRYAESITPHSGPHAYPVAAARAHPPAAGGSATAALTRSIPHRSLLRALAWQRGKAPEPSFIPPVAQKTKNKTSSTIYETGSRVGLHFGAELGREIEVNTSSADSAPFATIRTSTQLSDFFNNWSEGCVGPIVLYCCNPELDSAFAGFSEHAKCQSILTFASKLVHFTGVKTVEESPIRSYSISPTSGNCFYMEVSGWPFREGSAHTFGHLRIIPTVKGIENRELTMGVTVVPDAREYELAAECRNLAFRVVWNSTISVYPSLSAAITSWSFVKLIMTVLPEVI
jgi:hypothetical protein